MNRTLAAVLLPVVALLLIACGGDDKPVLGIARTPEPTTVDDVRVPLTFVTKSGKKPVLRAEIAQSLPEINIGLSRRPSILDDAGMLFVLPFRGPGFWMKDTLIPLSVAFIAACGDIVAIADMQPLSEQLHQADAEYRFGLEVNQGWFTRNGIAVGDKLTLPANLKQNGCP